MKILSFILCSSYDPDPVKKYQILGPLPKSNEGIIYANKKRQLVYNFYFSVKDFSNTFDLPMFEMISFFLVLALHMFVCLPICLFFYFLFQDWKQPG